VWEEPVISLPDIYQRGPSAIRNATTARKLVAILEEHGWLRRIPQGAVVAGQQRREAWRIWRPPR
jgi:predicted transcriptional regulator of viral defense system